jgi:hypothetical protein
VLPRSDDYDAVEYVGLDEPEARKLVEVYNAEGVADRLEQLLARRAKKNEDIRKPEPTPSCRSRALKDPSTRKKVHAQPGAVHEADLPAAVPGQPRRLVHSAVALRLPDAASRRHGRPAPPLQPSLSQPIRNRAHSRFFQNFVSMLFVLC